MSELPHDSHWEIDRAIDRFIFDFHEKLSVLLDRKIPEKFNAAVSLKERFDSLAIQDGIEDVAESNLFWTLDVLTDEIPNYRILLMPRELFRGIKFKNSEVKRLIINIPTPFIDRPSDGEPKNLDKISVCIVDLELANGKTATYAMSHKEVIPFDFRKYDFDFDEIDVRMNIVLDTNDFENQTPDVKLNLIEQAEIADIVTKAISGTYILARLSRHDGTTDKLE